MTPALIASSEKLLLEIDTSTHSLDPQTIASQLRQNCIALHDGSITEAEEKWLINEYLPLQLDAESNKLNDPWDSYFAPIGSRRDHEGNMIYFPDPFKSEVSSVENWKKHAKSLKHPILQARYADVIWDLGSRISPQTKREIEFGRIAVTAYLNTALNNLAPDAFTRFVYLKRGFNLAKSIGMTAEAVEFKRLLLVEHVNAHKDIKQGFIFTAYDFLISQKEAGLTELEHQRLTDDFEIALSKYTDKESEFFDVFFADAVGKRLIIHYTKKQLPKEVTRILTAQAHALEFNARKGNALFAASFLRDALDKYKEAKLHADAERVRIQLERTIATSQSEMATFSHSTSITKEEKLQFETSLVSDKPLITMQRIASQFLPRVRTLTAHIENMAKEAPLFSMLSQQIISDNQVVAVVGGVDNDMEGRLLLAASQDITLSTTWLKWGIDAAIKAHSLVPEQFVEYANRTGLFSDQRTNLLLEGFKAWYADDQVKAIHILIPQVEHALRSLARKFDHATTKEHKNIKGVSASIGMGDILFDDKIIDSFGEHGADLRLYLLAFYADPRGHNIRNRCAHGLLEGDDLSEAVTLRIVHTLILLTFIS